MYLLQTRVWACLHPDSLACRKGNLRQSDSAHQNLRPRQLRSVQWFCPHRSVLPVRYFVKLDTTSVGQAALESRLPSYDPWIFFHWHIVFVPWDHIAGSVRKCSNHM